MNLLISLANGKIVTRQCQAKSKRTQEQCRAPAMRGKRVCRFHGGKSTGPKTDEGRAASAAAKTVHGTETRAIRAERKKKFAELKMLGRLLGVK
jgi:hypothetical protein